MHIELTPQQYAMIESRIKSGLYDSPVEMIDRAFGLLEEQEFKRLRQQAFFEQELKPALDELDSSGSATMDMQDILRELRAEWDAADVPHDKND